MCGVIAAVFNEASNAQLQLLESVFHESDIRGKHATGVTWWDDHGLTRVCANDNHSLKGVRIEDYCERGKVRLIGHTRYSTSSLDVHQPLIDYQSESLSIAHNGVVDQKSNTTWMSKYGLTCHTNNDSELILRSMIERQNPLYKFPEASMAVAWINDNGKVGAFRNTKRPLWITYFDNGCIVTSTRDIIVRAGQQEGKKLDPIMIKPFVEVLLNNYQCHPLSMYGTTEEDLQNEHNS